MPHEKVPKIIFPIRLLSDGSSYKISSVHFSYLDVNFKVKCRMELNIQFETKRNKLLL